MATPVAVRPPTLREALDAVAAAPPTPTPTPALHALAEAIARELDALTAALAVLRTTVGGPVPFSGRL